MARGNIVALVVFGLMVLLFGYFFVTAGQPHREPTAVAAAAGQDAPNAPAPVAKKQYDSPPPMGINPEHKYVATLDTTKGKIVVELFAKDAPKTVNNFVFLSREGFYDGISFHRVEPNFVIQGGDPTASGRGGPGYKFEDEVGAGKPRHKMGSLSMANAGPNTNGSQFFITHVATPHLDGRHTVFGQTIEGQDVVNAIRVGDKINSIKIEETPSGSQTTQPAGEAR